MPFALEFCLSVPTVLRRILGDPLTVFFSHLLSSVPGGSEVITSAPYFGPEQLNSRDSGSPVHSCTVTRIQWTLRRMGGGSWRRGREAALAGEKGLLANSLGMGEQQGLGGVHKPGPICTWHPVSGAQGRMGGGTRML